MSLRCLLYAMVASTSPLACTTRFRGGAAATVMQGTRRSFCSLSRRVLCATVSDVSRVAQQLGSLAAFHAKTVNDEAKARVVERQAWQLLSYLDDSALQREASTPEVMQLLTTWCYFAKFWELGMDGPRPDSSTEAAATPSVEDVMHDFAVPLVSASNNDCRQLHSKGDGMNEIPTPPPRRSNVLDTVIDI